MPLGAVAPIKKGFEVWVRIVEICRDREFASAQAERSARLDGISWENDGDNVAILCDGDRLAPPEALQNIGRNSAIL